MQSLPIESIRIPPSRQRQEFDDARLSELITSINSIGIIHPIVIRQTPEGPTLVAGERRLRAIQNIAILGGRVQAFGTLLPEGHAPVTDIGSLDPERAFEAELEENIRRVDLTWQERTAAEAQLVELRKGQARKAGTVATILDVGKELFPDISEDKQREKTRQAVLLQSNMHIPEIARAPTQKEAWKVLQRLEQGKKDEILGKAIGSRASTDLYEVFNEDCRTWLSRQANDLYDCVLIDPPYGMGADTFGDAAGRNSGITHGYDDDYTSAMSLMRQVAGELYRVARGEAHCYVWCDIDGFADLRSTFSAAGWWVHRTPLINVKREGGRVPWPEHGPRRCYELVLYAVKGKKPVTAIYRDVFESTLERDTDGHGAAKPIEAYVELLKRSCRPGDRILDCFAGTGTILAAAAELKLRATAVELDPVYYGQIIRRLESLK